MIKSRVISECKETGCVVIECRGEAALTTHTFDPRLMPEPPEGVDPDVFMADALERSIAHAEDRAAKKEAKATRMKAALTTVLARHRVEPLTKEGSRNG